MLTFHNCKAIFLILPTNITSKIADGDLDKRIETARGDELGTLARSFSAMQESIQTRIFALQKAEEEVIQAAITTMRKGTKKDRRQWFQKVKETTKQMRVTEADEIYT